MSCDATPTDRHSAILAELAAMSLTLARDLQTRALEAASAEDATRLAAAFHQVARGLRQTLALELKVIRYKDEAADAAEEQAAVERLVAETHAEAVRRRRDAIGDHAQGAIWTEAEDLSSDEFPERFAPPEDPARLARELEAWLDRAAQRPDFLRADFDLLVIEACEAIGANPHLLYEIHDRHAAAPEPATADSS